MPGRVWSWNWSAVTPREPGCAAEKMWGENSVHKGLFNYQNCDPTNWAEQVCPQRKFCFSLLNLMASLPSPWARSAPCFPAHPSLCVQHRSCPCFPLGHSPCPAPDRAPQSSQELLPIKTARGEGAIPCAQPLWPALCWAPALPLLCQGQGGVELFCFGSNHRAGNSFQAVTFSFHWKGKTDS